MNWESGEGLLTVDEPSIVDAAFERGEPHVGVAVIGLSLNCDDLHVIAPRIARSITAGVTETRMQGFTALGHSVRLFRSLDSRLEPILRDFNNCDVAEIAIGDAIQFVPWLKLPHWLKMKALKQQLHWYLVERWR